ncbi:hypothetical protein AVEN_179410-1 [Araneus ventricosus]|uniref:Uncharacterized protein n=1 Tax=Araneus ventricosus TaxID=182803 RepID=A0A4Y2BDW2_ARAVE|nr:hypothetical protein AVEN_179410-1 [Araneus ventricosus]
MWSQNLDPCRIEVMDECESGGYYGWSTVCGVGGWRLRLLRITIVTSGGVGMDDGVNRLVVGYGVINCTSLVVRVMDDGCRPSL